MPRILSRSGASLADVYDVVGSIAGVETLHSEEVSLVHEMGSVLFSERLSPAIRQLNSGDLLQTITWGVTLATDLTTPARILGVSVVADVPARITRASILLQDADGAEFPIWAWDIAVDDEKGILMDLTGAGAATHQLMLPLQPLEGNVPSMLFGDLQPEAMPNLIFRGLTETFGAGNVNCTAKVLTCHAAREGLSSLGLPVPSW